MERKERGNPKCPFGLRFVRRQTERAPGRWILALLVAAVLLFGLCYLQNIIGINEREMERLYSTIEVTGRILPKDTRTDTRNNGFLTYAVPQALKETGFIREMVLESGDGGNVRGCKPDGTLTGKDANTRVRGVSSLSRYAPVEDGSAAMSFLPDWDAETFHQPHQFDGKEEVYGVLIRPAIGEVLGVEPGDYVILNLQGSSGLLYVCGIFSGGSNDFANLIVSMEGLDSIYQKAGMEPQYLYTRCDFTIDPAKNRQIHEFREKAEALLAEDLKVKEEQWLSESKTLFVLRDSELTQAIQPLEKNLSLMRLLYPITQAVAALVSAALAMLLLAQRAKDTAILRVLGISRSQTRWMLGVEPVLAALLGAGLGVLLAFMILGRQALGTSCLISLGLYLAGCLLGTILGTVRAVNRKPLELLQVKE